MKNKYWTYRHVKESKYIDYIEYSCKLQLITLYIFKDKGNKTWLLQLYNNIESLVKNECNFSGTLKDAKLELIAIANKYLSDIINNANKDMGQLG